MSRTEKINQIILSAKELIDLQNEKLNLLLLHKKGLEQQLLFKTLEDDKTVYLPHVPI